MVPVIQAIRSKVVQVIRDISSRFRAKSTVDVENPIDTSTVERIEDISIPAGISVFRGSDLRMLDIVGEGDMGVVRKVHIRSSTVASVMGTTAVVKIVKAEMVEDRMEAVHECSVLMRLNSLRNVVTPFGLYVQGSDVGIVMERLNGPVLTELVSDPPLHAMDVLVIMQQVFFVLSQMHGMNVAHMDVKPSNIIIHQSSSSTPRIGTVKLFDCGIAIDGGNKGSVFDQMWEESAGSIGYQAPEVFDGEMFSAASADVWGAGVTWAELTTGSRLFVGENVDDYLDDVERKVGHMDSVLGAAYMSTIEVRHLLMGCLEFNPARRPSAHYVSEFLRGRLASA